MNTTLLLSAVCSSLFSLASKKVLWFSGYNLPVRFSLSSHLAEHLLVELHLLPGISCLGGVAYTRLVPNTQTNHNIQRHMSMRWVRIRYLGTLEPDRTWDLMADLLLDTERSRF